MISSRSRVGILRRPRTSIQLARSGRIRIDRRLPPRDRTIPGAGGLSVTARHGDLTAVGFQSHGSNLGPRRLSSTAAVASRKMGWDILSPADIASAPLSKAAFSRTETTASAPETKHPRPSAWCAYIRCCGQAASGTFVCHIRRIYISTLLTAWQQNNENLYSPEIHPVAKNMRNIEKLN